MNLFRGVLYSNISSLCVCMCACLSTEGVIHLEREETAPQKMVKVPSNSKSVQVVGIRHANTDVFKKHFLLNYCDFVLPRVDPSPALHRTFPGLHGSEDCRVT